MFGVIKILIQGLLGGLALSLPSIIKRLAIALGVGVFSFTGLTFILDQLKSLAISSLSGIPASVIGIVGVLNIDKAFTIVMSAYAIKLSIQLLGGTAKKVIGLN